MNREIYMKCLGEYLRKLPKEDFITAMEYFREYFDEAGPENEEQAIKDLGSPSQAAEQIIMDMAMKNTEEAPKKSVKGNFSAVWVGILAVFAAPIALPLAFAAVVLVGSFAFVILTLLACLVLTGVLLVAGAVVSIVLSMIMVFRSPIHAITTIGTALIAMGVGLLICPAAVKLTKACLRWITRIFGNMVRKFSKGGRKSEKEK